MMKNEFTVEEIKELITAISKNKMHGLKIQSGEYSIEIKGACETVVVAGEVPVQGQGSVAAAAAPAAQDSPAIPDGNVVTSPIVGTFYEAPSPENPAFVKAGSQVKRGDVLFIIESMKLMNEVTSQFDGMVEQIHVKNGQPVEYGQPIMTIN